jgi:hypothetical protein
MPDWYGLRNGLIVCIAFASLLLVWRQKRTKRMNTRKRTCRTSLPGMGTSLALFRRASHTENSRSKEQQAAFDFDELSDGQRSLIALYTIRKQRSASMSRITFWRSGKYSLGYSN